MAASPTWKEFVQSHGSPKDRTRLRTLWLNRFGPNANQPTVPAPEFVPGVLDTQGQGALNELSFGLRSNLGLDAGLQPLRDAAGTPIPGALQAAYQRRVAQAQGMLPQIEHGRNKGLRNVLSSHAARGTARSGLRALDEAEVNRDSDQQFFDAQREIVDASNEYQRNYGNELGKYLIGKQQVGAEADERRLGEFVKQPIAAAPARQPLPVEDDKPTWQQFLGTHKGQDPNRLRTLYKKRWL